MKWPWRIEKDDSSYSIFTTSFDMELSSDDLGRKLTGEEREIWQEQIAAFETATEVARTKVAANLLACVDSLRDRMPEIETSTAVSVLIDHSGSLKGQKAMLACLLAEVIGEFLGRLGVSFEILGFTTSSWCGGQSRKRWVEEGRPPNPGRLCDLLHIRYREATSSGSGVPRAIRHLLRSDLLKENIDGEALFWASERLKNLGRPRNVLVVISDGVPVDDSTLMANRKDFLWEHLLSVVSDLLATSGFGVAGIGIDHDVSKIYPKSLKVDRLDQLSTVLPGFLSALFD